MLRNLNPVTPIADADIPASIARDSEIDEFLAKVLLLFNRSASTPVNGNTPPITGGAGFMWVDGAVGHTNLPVATGILFHFDPLADLPTHRKLFQMQVMVAGAAASSATTIYVRHQNNGAWASWRAL